MLQPFDVIGKPQAATQSRLDQSMQGQHGEVEAVEEILDLQAQLGITLDLELALEEQGVGITASLPAPGLTSGSQLSQTVTVIVQSTSRFPQFMPRQAFKRCHNAFDRKRVHQP